MVTVTPGGLLTATGLACGNSLVSATVTTNHSSSGAIVTGYMTANVVCFTAGAGALGPTLTVDFAGGGSGTVTSSPAGLGCSTNYSASFASGTTITFTATPNGSMFSGWLACDALSGRMCTVSNLTSNRTVTVTFN